MSRKGENIFKRKDGRWEARYIHHYEEGKAKYHSLYGATYSEAIEKKMAAVQITMGLRPHKLPEALCTFEDLAEAWLCDVKYNVKESTFTRYHRIVICYLFPNLKGKLLQRIDQKCLNNLTGTLLDSGGKSGRALSPKTVTDILCVLKSILRYGADNDFPCPGYSRLKYPAKKGRATTILTDEIRIKIEEKLLKSEDQVSLGILFTLFTGVRIGELCGLRWADIDFVNHTVHISRTVERIADLNPNSLKKTKVVITEPKTQSSIRVIPLPKFMMDYLRQRRCDNDCYLLTGKQKFTEPHQYYMCYKRFLKRNAIDHHTFHTLRHTFATRCVEIGFDTKSLSEILGHANITTTLSIYVHPSLQQKKVQMEKLTPYLPPSNF